MPTRRRPWSLAARVFGLQLAATLVIGTALLVALVLDGRQRAEDSAAERSLAVSRTVAADPAVQEALLGPDPTAELEPYALELVATTEVDFVTIMSPDGIRFTHPDPSLIGEKFLGTITAAQAGETITETFTGTLGPSLRAVVPIELDDRLVGIVSAGVTTENIAEILEPRLPFLLAITGLTVAVNGAVALLLLRSLRRSAGTLGPEQMRRMVDFYESVLHSVREGVVLTDRDRRVVLYNDEAADLLGLPPAPEGPDPRHPSDLGIDDRVAEVLTSGRRVVEESFVAGDRVLLINQEPTRSIGRSASGDRTAAIMTLRDQSVLEQLSGELQSVRTMTSALRSQAHEYSNTLHTIVSLLELGRVDEAVTLVTDASHSSQLLTDAVLDQVSDPVLAALLVGKSAQASERGVELTVDAAPGVEIPLTAKAMVSVVGNLLDNAIEAALRSPARVASGVVSSADRSVHLELHEEDAHVVLQVSDSGPGRAESDEADWFERGSTSKTDQPGAHGIGLAVVATLLADRGATVTVEDGSPTTITVRFAPVRGSGR